MPPNTAQAEVGGGAAQPRDIFLPPTSLSTDPGAFTDGQTHYFPPIKNPVDSLLNSSKKKGNETKFSPFSEDIETLKPAKYWPPEELDPEVDVGDRVCKYGREFTWTSLHKKGRYFESLRQRGDELADEVLEKVRALEFHWICLLFCMDSDSGWVA